MHPQLQQVLPVMYLMIDLKAAQHLQQLLLKQDHCSVPLHDDPVSVYSRRMHPP